LLLSKDRILRFLWTYGCWLVCDDDIGKDAIRREILAFTAEYLSRTGLKILPGRVCKV
jgi:hypothetical protein